MQVYLLLHGLDWDEKHPHIIDMIFFKGPGPETLYLFIELMLIRVGMIAFETKYTMYSFREKWKSYVTTSDPHDIASWHIRWFPKLRSLTWIYIYIYFFFFFKKKRGSSFFLEDEAMNIFQTVITGCYVCLGAILVWSIPKYKDYFGIRDEVITTLKIGLIAIVMYFFVYIVFERRMDPFVRALLLTVSYLFALFVMVMRSTWYVLRGQYSNIESHLRKTNVHIMGLFVCQSDSDILLSPFSSPSSSSSPSHPVSPALSGSVVLDFVDVVKDLKGFELFMEHLFSGVCVCCFFFVVVLYTYVHL
ncbi:hypothetical protein RFI_26135 [Reticulomyxa filosa]|uniref:Uncharacterized protein n=1 Tax=Reticulomyxa filosa TaxID=46433 RepID=X6MCR5_RETFI|nr:hypothetical protein RFI_26135 [Reticulomyxa filosa]|eukprot:ETO11242.1 hypothetical protein RFI_26135 [Reticulomyxa filosa]